MRRSFSIAACLSWALAAAAAPLAVHTSTQQAIFDGAALTRLTDREGHATIDSEGTPTSRVVILRENNEHSSPPASGVQTLPAANQAVTQYSSFNDLPGASARVDLGWGEAAGDLAVTLSCQAPQKGVAGIEWLVGPIPAAMNIIVPGYGGMKMTARAATTRVSLQYPMFWEAQMVIVEGQGHGFYVWADDPLGRYKRLTVTLKPDGWWLGFTTWNNAPFAALDACQSVTWRINVYHGDWRVPARRYSDWARASMPAITDRQPTWVNDIRCVVIMFDGPDSKTVDMLATRVDPRQTLLYVPDWRPDGYDRMYPNYEPVAWFGAFVERAHALGFRVMPHLNYFACDPEHPLYEQFKAHHVRDPWGTHDPQWFIWDDPSNPANNRKLGYINPAHKPWRDLMVERIRMLRETYAVDAVYLDQTLNIFNDYNGLEAGSTMLQGNLALAREIRAALPDLAIGGEGLNEVTARYQSFCQRHAWGIDFARSTWNKAQLKLAHPISTYLFRPVHTFNYLGVPAPDRAQYYAAWRENLTRWGALPTLMVYTSEAKPRTGFLRQIFEEVSFWQTERVDPDMDGSWPEDVVFPYRTAQGQAVMRRTDGSLNCGERQISRTISDVGEVALPGTVEGSFCFDTERIFGLNPDLWYPYFADKRDNAAFHVAALPAGTILKSAALFEGLAILKMTPTVLAYLPEMMTQATTGSIPFDGDAIQVLGPLNGDDGSQFAGAGDQIHAHPPWKAGTGVAYARWTLKLPANTALRFTGTVALDSGAVGTKDALDPTGVGTSDGVLFGVTARLGAQSLHREVFNDTAREQPLELDLTPFSGQEIALELTVHPGPRQNVTADWARWYGPRVVQGGTAAGRLRIVDPAQKTMVLSGTKASTPSYVDNQGEAEVSFPGTVMLLREPPAACPPLPVQLGKLRFLSSFTDANGQVLTAPPWAAATPGTCRVGGVERQGLHVQPPDLGQTVVAYALNLPLEPARFHCLVGLQDGSPSTGIVFIIQANGMELARLDTVPGEPWRELTADLSPWAGKPVVLSLITDSAGPFGGDWGRWGDPCLLSP